MIHLFFLKVMDFNITSVKYISAKSDLKNTFLEKSDITDASVTKPIIFLLITSFICQSFAVYSMKHNLTSRKHNFSNLGLTILLMRY